MKAPSDLRAQARELALEVLEKIPLPPGTALAATGSFARGEMTTHSDLDLILLHDDSFDAAQTKGMWYPVWDAKYRLDVAVRTPEECAAIAAEDASAGLAQLDLSFVAGRKILVDSARAKLLAAWRSQLQRGFDGFIDSAISRWHRSGSVSAMTNPDLKNGRGGLRDIQLLRALALGNLCDMPYLEEEKNLLLDVRTLLHEHAKRHRDALDPEFAADIAQEMGFKDRYELSAALVSASTTVEQELELSLAVARTLIARHSRISVRRPLDIDVIDAGGRIELSRTPNLDDPWLVARVGAASARTGLPISDGCWQQLQTLPTADRWTRAAVEDFYAILSFPGHTGRVIKQLDAHGLWERFVPEWGHIRGLLPRERSHVHSVDAHTIATVAGVAENRTKLARPDLLLLSALCHDLGKGYGRPHEQVGAEIVARQAASMGLVLADRSRVQTVVREHTTLARLAARMDPYSDKALDLFLTASGYDPLVVNLLAVLAKADALATGPGVWTKSLETFVNVIRRRARAQLAPRARVRPRVALPSEEVTLDVDWKAGNLMLGWRGENQRAVNRLLSLTGAFGWSIVHSSLVRNQDGSYAAKCEARVQQQTLAAAFDKPRFIQAYKSKTYSELPKIHGQPTTAMFDVGGVLEVRTVERTGALGRLIDVLPEIEWLSHDVMGATMVVQIKLAAENNRTLVVSNVTRALASD